MGRKPIPFVSIVGRYVAHQERYARFGNGPEGRSLLGHIECDRTDHGIGVPLDKQQMDFDLVVADGPNRRLIESDLLSELPREAGDNLRERRILANSLKDVGDRNGRVLLCRWTVCSCPHPARFLARHRILPGPC